MLGLEFTIVTVVLRWVVASFTAREETEWTQLMTRVALIDGWIVARVAT